ncbi:MAG: DUF3617 family protein [Rhodocyclaceae bacterium]|nr:DUF3617 family protein [Rhodocyclaceae bacterium]
MRKLQGRMRACALLALAVSGAACAAGSTVAADAAALPQPRAGLWQVESRIVELGGLPMRWQVCVGEEPLASLLARMARQEQCSEHEVRAGAGGGVAVRMQCRLQGSQVASEGTFSGDIRQSFSGTLHSRFSPPWQGLEQSSAQLSGQWLSACKPGQKPGTVVRREAPNVDEVLRSADSLLRGLR